MYVGELVLAKGSTIMIHSSKGVSQEHEGNMTVATELPGGSKKSFDVQRGKD